jgi:uncharacterized tellurite resistance protein B-like protein
MSILKWLGFAVKEEASEGRPEAESVRKLVGALEQLEPERARWLGAFAFILARVAHADLHISDEEVAEMERILCAEGELPQAQATLVVQIAKANRIFGATDDFLATREFKARSNREERLKLLRCLFAVSAADDKITTVEEETVRQIANELGLDHNEYVTIRAEYRDKREVLKE